MILTFHPPAMGVLSLDVRNEYGPRVELEAFTFVNDPPAEFRFCRDGIPLCDWNPGDRDFHDLQRNRLETWTERDGEIRYTDPPQPTDHVTFGLSPRGLTLETRSLIGSPLLLVWLRQGTFSESGSCAS